MEQNIFMTEASMRMLMCRGCLATDKRLFDMRQNRLMESYCTLLSTVGLGSDDLPHYMCSYCAALLLKCDTFRIKCIDSLIILRNAQQDNLDLTTENIEVDGYAFLKQSELNTINILDKTRKKMTKNTARDIPSDYDVSSGSDVATESDTSLDLNSIDKDDSHTEDEAKFNINVNQQKSKTKKNPKQSDNEFQSLLTTYKGNKGDKSGLLRDFNINFDGVQNDNEKNIKSQLLESLSEIIKHVQYSSETSTELLGILDDNNDKRRTKDKNINKTPEQDTKPILKHEGVIKSGPNLQNPIDNEIDVKPTFIKTELKVEFVDDIDTEHHNFDSDDEVVIADLKSKPESKRKKGTSKKTALNYRGCKKIISNILKGNQTKKMKRAEELYAMYDTEVKYLSKDEQINDVRARRESDNYKNGQFKCELCFKGFLVQETYENHMSLHDDISGKFVCEICHCHFRSKARLLGHQNRHAKKFTCKECGHNTRHGSLAIQHYEWHKGKKYSCKDCGKEFQNKSSQYGHIKMCHPTSEQLVRCEICGDSFNGLSGLQHHDSYAHKEKNTPECLCTVCGTQFYCSDALKAHRGAGGACSPRAKYCVRCGGAFHTQLQLEEHEAEQRKLQYQFKCDLCPRTFKYFSQLKLHQRHHTDSYHEFMKQYYERRGKMDREDNSEELVCEVCGKLCKNTRHLKSHYFSAHSTAKPFKCPTCPKAFKSSALLVTHSRVHTGERPFKCEHCPKAFQNVQNLKRHNLVHTGERPHSCEVCGKSFQSRGCVKMHVKTVHMKIPMPPRIRNRKKKTE